MVLVVVKNGVAEQHVDKNKETNMKTATGFTNLLKISKNIPESEGWYIFVDSDFDHTKKCIESANYYLTETEEEDDDMDEQKDNSWRIQCIFSYHQNLDQQKYNMPYNKKYF